MVSGDFFSYKGLWALLSIPKGAGEGPSCCVRSHTVDSVSGSEWRCSSLVGDRDHPEMGVGLSSAAGAASALGPSRSFVLLLTEILNECAKWVMYFCFRCGDT